MPPRPRRTPPARSSTSTRSTRSTSTTSPASGGATSRPARGEFERGYRAAGGSSAPDRAGLSRSAGTAAGVVDEGAGFVLALMFWGWIALPFLRGGPAEVRRTLKAKFLNKAPDGSWLP